ncbi:MAG TPA: RluA family pseudouridine synthase [Balneolaceae bacterium]|nr:RluA family pseudouridine synthase [Balneolaceae bacterium]
MKHTNTRPNISIIFEDDHLLIIDKPVNVLSQEDHTGDPDVLKLCKQYLGRNQNGNPYVGLVHRLDRPVGGLMILAKSRKAADNLSQQIRDRVMQKTYWAVTSGSPPQNGVLTHYLQKDRENNLVSVASKSQKKAKEAILSFAKLETVDELHLLSIHLQTGRPHQIRVQLAEEGYPIWGDYKYGLAQSDGRDIALRSVELVFNHPQTKREMRFELAPKNTEPWSRFAIAKY